jgi:peptide/nickel transport system substrate-binding protein
MTSTRSWLPSYTSRITRRRFIGGAAAGIGGAALLAACGGGSNEGGLKLIKGDEARVPGGVWASANTWRLEDETKNAVPGGVFRSVASSDLPQNMDTVTLATSQVPFSEHNHEFLLAGARRPGLDPASVEASFAIPALAEAWEFSDDGMTVTFTMRQNVKFHNVAPVNGRVMDIEDWKTTDERFRAESQYRVGMPATVDRATFPDARHMVWHMNSPLAGIQSMIYGPKWTWMLQPKEQHRDRTLAETKSIGTGFKQMESYQPGIGYEYVKHKDYWGGEPFIDRWRVPIIPEYANRYAQFTTGEIQHFTPNARDIVNLAKDVPQAMINLEEILTTHLDCHFFGLTNAKTAAWGDPRVRVALRQSIDYKGISEIESARPQLAAAGIDIEVVPTTHVTMMPGVWLNPEKGELGELSKNFLYDPAEAKKNLSAAGVTGPVKIPFHIESVTDMNTLTIDSLKRSGNFDPEVITYPNSVAYRDCGRNLTCEGTMMQLSHDDEIDRVIYRQFHSLGNIARGPQPYADDKLDAMIIAQRVELDVERRRALLKDLQLELARRMDAIPGRHHFNVVAFQWPWLHNIGWGHSEGMPGGRDFWGAHKQWLDPEMTRRNG